MPDKIVKCTYGGVPAIDFYINNEMKMELAYIGIEDVMKTEICSYLSALMK